ncbi:YitT family protein [Phenylobacterium deserti]|uniref:YitT family protein n=1 Tax=Phenylobacterium deserti TaxID=1914756 RepID=A0A328AT88_9CAUL|nr:YitT family protein [Phenylobacterium deserti]RAK57485.1 YitT family protein [Phenylobacterium deserti]
MSQGPRHTPAEDVHAILIGASFCAFGIVMLKAAGLVTGGVAGAALIVSYLTGLPVGPTFFALNVPFYLLAWRALGPVFTARTLVTNSLLAGLSLMIPQWVTFAGVDPVFAALFGGTIIGMGILALARHRSSVGGVGVLALWMQEKRGISAGKVQVCADVLIVGAAFFILPLDRLGLSILSAVALSLVMIAYHRPGRYMGY